MEAILKIEEKAYRINGKWYILIPKKEFDSCQDCAFEEKVKILCIRICQIPFIFKDLDLSEKE